jgi:hypothetical protein
MAVNVTEYPLGGEYGSTLGGVSFTTKGTPYSILPFFALPVCYSFMRLLTAAFARIV